MIQKRSAQPDLATPRRRRPSTKGGRTSRSQLIKQKRIARPKPAHTTHRYEEPMFKTELGSEGEKALERPVRFYHAEAGGVEANIYEVPHGQYFPATPSPTLQSHLDPNPYNFEDIIGITNGFESEPLFHRGFDSHGIDNPLLLGWKGISFSKPTRSGIMNTYAM